MAGKDILDIINTLSLTIIAIGLSIALFYLIKILRDISKVTQQLREKGQKFADLISVLVTLVKKGVLERKKKK